MLRVPYQADTELYKADHLGLIRYDKKVGLNADLLEESEDDNDADDDSDAVQSELSSEKAMMLGQPVHTEYGDGTITRITRKKVKVRLANGESVLVSKLATFVIDRDTTNAHDMKAALTRMNAPDIALDEEPPEVPVDGNINDIKVRRTRRARTTDDEGVTKNSTGLRLGFTIINDMLMLTLLNSDDEEARTLALQFGFVQVPEYVYAPVRNADQFVSMMWSMVNAGYKIPRENSSHLKNMLILIRQFRSLRKVNPHGMARKRDYDLFFRNIKKPGTDLMLVQPFPLFTDPQSVDSKGKSFCVAFPSPGSGHPSTRNCLIAIKKGMSKEQSRKDSAGNVHTVGPQPPLRWFTSGSNPTHLFVAGKNEARRSIREIESAGVVILNKDELIEQYNTIKFRGKNN